MLKQNKKIEMTATPTDTNTFPFCPRRLLCGLAGMLWLVALAGCNSPQERYRQRLAGTQLPAVHAVHNDRLKALMGHLNALFHERMLTEPQIDAERRLRSREIAAVSTEMSGTLDAVLEIVPQLSLSTQQETLFRETAVSLKAELATLQRHAQANRIEAMAPTLERIQNTCDTCHNLFRAGTSPEPTQ